MVREITLRNIPGTFSSGRISDVAIDPRNRNIWYVATSSGGLWKTTNRGIAFQPIFDDGGSYSLGCVAVDPRNSDVVWLGTGENQSQRAIGWGDGIYKSLDAGKTWRNVGLKNSEHIAKILVDPRDSNVVYVASQGPLFSPGGDRGLYKTTDGGQTWKPILQISENTGITDFDIDPRNPDVMYAAAYQRRRNTSVIVAGHFQDYRWRKELEETDRRPAPRGPGPHRPGRLAAEARRGVRPHHDRARQQAVRLLPQRGWRRALDPRRL
jgi:hypothetical protein